MKFRKKPQLSNDLIESIMLNRGIQDIELYLNPTNADDTDLSQLPNIEECVETIKRHMGNDILILVDSDADGNTSAAIMYKYLKIVNPFATIRYFIHEHKTHGFTSQFMEYVRDTKPDLVIVPDAGTNDIEQRQEIAEMGIDLIVIDHHNEDKYSDRPAGILINNHATSPRNNINKNLTGAGMTYLVCKALDKFAFNTNRVEELKDLAMVGIIGDCASLFENETRNLCMNALRDIKSNMVKTVIEENNQSLDEVTFTNMQWGGIIPLINAVVRIGTLEEKELMFKALADIETDYFRIVEKRKLNKETRKYEKIPFKLNIYQLAIDAARTCKARQDKIVAEEIKLAESKFDETAGIQVYEVQTDECKPLTGLLANKLTSLWQQPVIVVWNLDGAYTGSLRGWEKSLPNLKKWCESTKLFRLVQGHDNAAGVVIDAQNLQLVREAAKHVEYEEFAYEVEKLYNERVEMIDIFTISENKSIFKNGIPEPIFGITNLQISPEVAKWSKNTMRINLNGVTYIKFKVTEEEFNDLIENRRKIDAVGTFDVNVWNNREFPQFQISEYEIVKENLQSIDFGIFA